MTDGGDKGYRKEEAGNGDAEQGEGWFEKVLGQGWMEGEGSKERRDEIKGVGERMDGWMGQGGTMDSGDHPPLSLSLSSPFYSPTTFSPSPRSTNLSLPPPLAPPIGPLPHITLIHPHHPHLHPPPPPPPNSPHCMTESLSSLAMAILTLGTRSRASCRMLGKHSRENTSWEMCLFSRKVSHCFTYLRRERGTG